MAGFEKITEGISLLKVPFGPVWTGIVLVQGDENYLIDSGASGEDVDRYVLPALRALGIGSGDVRWLLNTHCHGDHIGGHRALAKALGVQVAAYAGSVPKLLDPAAYAIRIRTEFPDHSPPPQSNLRGIGTDRSLGDGAVLGDRLQLIHTPGHDDDCVCWYDRYTKTLITGDSLQGNGTVCQGIGFYQDLPAYRRTLERLATLDVETILCGHDYDGIGWRIQGKEAVRSALNRCLDDSRRYHAFIAERFRDGERDCARIATELIDALGCGQPQHLFMAMYTVNQHLTAFKKEEKL